MISMRSAAARRLDTHSPIVYTRSTRRERERERERARDGQKDAGEYAARGHGRNAIEAVCDVRCRIEKASETHLFLGV